MTDSEWDALESEKKIPKHICAVKLFSHNKDVEALNGKMLKMLETPSKTWTARDDCIKLHGTGDWAGREIPPEAGRTFQHHSFPNTLELKVGAKVVLPVNFNDKSKLVNGSQGEVVGFKKCEISGGAVDEASPSIHEDGSRKEDDHDK